MFMNVDFLWFSLLLGVGATLFMDLYAVFIKRVFQIPSLDYALLGRWIGHFNKGMYRHPNIMVASKIEYERVIGWCAHYMIGVAFAFLLLLLTGIDWVCNPSFLPALILGVLTTVAPFFMMQPAFGFGITASKTPKPNIARLRSLQAHTAYGVGLYVTGVIISFLFCIL
ncbi:DUF2938 domain-containing protein [Myroides guanonis]|uniref:DUF2938 domain-containing protein n=1 Tax=Myroides guanonis TaxID=1150112 RepID=A0A1I3PDP3_9FLAO|nr:DUF2938 domain-containing protein [Myroides guanonis]SFJ19668.1 Protein of unknown function [Myroides guanonis]